MNAHNWYSARTYVQQCLCEVERRRRLFYFLPRFYRRSSVCEVDTCGLFCQSAEPPSPPLSGPFWVRHKTRSVSEPKFQQSSGNTGLIFIPCHMSSHWPLHPCCMTSNNHRSKFDVTPPSSNPLKLMPFDMQMGAIALKKQSIKRTRATLGLL